MEAAVCDALAPLGGKLPARVFYDDGSVWGNRTDAARFLPLSHCLQAIDGEFDLHDPKRAYDLDRLLGDCAT